jgi:hypothetical protein
MLKKLHYIIRQRLLICSVLLVFVCRYYEYHDRNDGKILFNQKLVVCNYYSEQ